MGQAAAESVEIFLSLYVLAAGIGGATLLVTGCAILARKLWRSVTKERSR